MNQPLKVISGPMQAAGPALHSFRLNVNDFRTVLKRCLRELMLLLVVILSMSVFTVATIVLVVTTVANAGPYLQGSDWNADANVWSHWSSSPAGSLYGGRDADMSLAPPIQTMPSRPSLPAEYPISSDYVALWMPDE